MKIVTIYVADDGEEFYSEADTAAFRVFLQKKYGAEHPRLTEIPSLTSSRSG